MNIEFHKLSRRLYESGDTIDPNDVLKFGPFFIRFLKTKHSVPCYGMRITDGTSTMVYTADSALPRRMDQILPKMRIYYSQTRIFMQTKDGTEAGHMTSEEVGMIAKEANVKEVDLHTFTTFRGSWTV